MSTVTTGLYEEDLHGTNPNNIVENERHTLVTPSRGESYFFIPQAAPFFVDSMEIINEATGLPLVEGVDYMIGHKFIEAMKSTGRPIAGSIRIMKRSLQTIVKIRYRTIGGVWGFSEAQIIAELGRRQYNPLIRTWGAIGTLPYSFPSLDHQQPIDGGLVGSEEVLGGLNRIADVLEATASGTTESHLRDFNNPHKTDKIQVGLSQVMNYPMASNTEATAATRTDLYISPYGVYLAIQEHAIKRLLSHMNDFANPHKVQAVHVGLDRVPNYPAATAEQAVDITNNSTLMTPYTTSLLIARASDGGRIDELTNRLNAHINDFDNPHRTKPGQLGDGGAYTKTEIDLKLSNVSATDTPKFNGLTEAEWRASLPAFEDLAFLCDGLTEAFQMSEQVISQVNPDNPVTPADEALILAKKASFAYAAFSMYSVSDGNLDSVLVTSSDITQFPEHLSGGQNNWAQLENAGYYIDANGAIVAFGSAAIPTPAGYGPVGHNPDKAVSDIWACKTSVWIMLQSGDLERYDRTSVATMYNASQFPAEVWVGSEHTALGELAVVQVFDTDDHQTQQAIFYPHGQSDWVNKARVVMADVSAKGSPIVDMRIANEYVIFLTAENKLYAYQIVRTPVFDLVEVPLVEVRKASDGTRVQINQLERVLSIAGTYGQIGIIISPGYLPVENPADTPQLIPYGELHFLGSDAHGQQEIPEEAGPFIGAASGNEFVVTINNKYHVQFWGNSPDNALMFKHRSIT